MMRLVLLVLMFCFIHGYGQNNAIQKKVLTDLDVYLDSMNTISMFDGKYNVFVLKFHNTNKSYHGFTVGKIVNEHELKLINVTHFTMIDTNYILVCNNNHQNNLFADMIVQSLEDSSVYANVLQRLMPISEGAINHSNKGVVYKYNSSGFRKYYYDNLEVLSKEFLFFKNYPIIKRVRVDSEYKRKSTNK